MVFFLRMNNYKNRFNMKNCIIYQNYRIKVLFLFSKNKIDNEKIENLIVSKYMKRNKNKNIIRKNIKQTSQLYNYIFSIQIEEYQNINLKIKFIKMSIRNYKVFIYIIKEIIIGNLMKIIKTFVFIYK